jgi:membrane protease YdiL (CAAX protease family)
LSDSGSEHGESEPELQESEPGQEPGAAPGPALAGALTIGAALTTTLLFVAFVSGLDPVASRALAVVLGTGSIGALAATYIPEPHGPRVGLRRIDARSVFAVALIVPVALLGSEVDNWARLLLGAPSVFGDAAPEPRSAGLWLQTLLLLVAIEPLIEEWFFRGVLQQGSRERLGATGAMVWCALLFAVYAAFGRATSGADAAAIIAQSFALGMAFGYVRVATGSLLAPILLHASINATAILGSQFFPIAGFTAEGTHTDPMILFGAALCCALGVWRLETPPVAEFVEPPGPRDSGDPKDEPGGEG